MQLTLADVPWVWHLQHLGVSGKIRLHLHSFTQCGLFEPHAGTPMPRDLAFLSTKDPQALYTYILKYRTRWLAETAKFRDPSELETGPLLKLHLH